MLYLKKIWRTVASKPHLLDLFMFATVLYSALIIAPVIFFHAFELATGSDMGA